MKILLELLHSRWDDGLSATIITPRNIDGKSSVCTFCEQPNEMPRASYDADRSIPFLNKG